MTSSDEFLTVWQGTVSGLWLGAVAAVCLICLVRCSTQSSRSCWWGHTTWRRSNIVPAERETTALEELRGINSTQDSSLSYLPLSSKACLWASQSSSLVTVMLARGNFPCREESSHENQEVIEKLLFICSSESGAGVLRRKVKNRQMTQNNAGLSFCNTHILSLTLPTTGHRDHSEVRQEL